MVAEKVVQHCTQSEANDMKALDSYSNVENISNGLQPGVFSMEDLGQAKEVIQDSNTMVKCLENEVTLQPPMQSLELVESVSASHFLELDAIQSNNNGGNGSLVGLNEELGSGTDEVDGSKRPEDECKNKESSVRIVYSSLPSQSKRKLEELLHQWSEWHTQNFKSADDLADCLESGEETYFPAIHVGSEKSLAVSFSMDVHVRKRQRKESLSLNNDGSPLYDRGYAVGLASDEGIIEERVVDLREAPRCFNCGSYNHPLSECQKPRDNAAVNSARKQYLSKRNQNTGPRVQTRYYQESPAGKFDGLKPGALSAETRKLLGLGELDPPPWLNRMRELGYPVGYFDSEEEEQPSGIAIFGDEESQNMDMRNGLSLDVRKSQKKMTVGFPGINAPIPENADQKNWMGPSPDNSWNQSNHRWNHAREALNNGHFHGAYVPRNHIEAPPSPFGLEFSPPVPHYLQNYPPREPFSPRDAWTPGSPHYGRPADARRPFMLHYDYGSL